MDLLNAARAMISALAIYHEDAAPEHRADKLRQLEEVAQAVAGAIERRRGGRDELAFLVAWGSAESHYSERIGRGECGPLECDARWRFHGAPVSYAFWRARKDDPEAAVEHLAAGYWQVRAVAASSLEAWEASRTDPFVAAREAARVAARARGYCRSLDGDHDPVRMAFSVLAGRGCAGWFRGLDARVATYRRLLGVRVPS